MADSASPPGGCQKDTDCKGERVCEKGSCHSPKATSEAPDKKGKNKSPAGLKAALKAKPAPFGHPSFAARIEACDYENDSERLGEYVKNIAAESRRPAEALPAGALRDELQGLLEQGELPREPKTRGI